MKKGFWLILVIIFGLYIIQKMSVPSFKSYREKAKMNTGQSTNQQVPIEDNSATSVNQLVSSSTAPVHLYDPIQNWGKKK